MERHQGTQLLVNMCGCAPSEVLHTSQAYKEAKHFETPYVVKLWRYAALGPILPVFTFEHPNRAAHIDNRRCVFDQQLSTRVLNMECASRHNSRHVQVHAHVV